VLSPKSRADARTGAKSEKLDAFVVRSALRELDRRLRERLGRRHLKLMLFGNCARGDNAPESDADVALIYAGISPIGGR
jgi:predicted nucleotidyltransferase